MMKMLYKLGLWILLGLIAGGFSSSCNDNDEIIYRDSETDDPDVTRLNVSPRNVEMSFVDEREFTVALRPVASKIEWESDRPDIAYVDENNKIIPVGIGDVKFIAKSGDLADTVTATIHSAIIGDLYFIEKGTTSKMDNIRILPEGTPYEVTNNSENLMNVSKDLTVTALSEGIGTLNITTEDEISATVTVGVMGPKVTLDSANEYLYDGAELGHASYGYSVMTFGTSGAVYEGDATWSGSGQGLALKFYRLSDSETAPDGTYSEGTTVNSFFADNSSYVVDPGTNEKDNIKRGSIIINGNSVTAYVMTASKVYQFACSATRPSEKRHLLTEYVTTIDNDYCGEGQSKMYVDTGGTVFYGGYDHCWQLRLAKDNTNYLQLFMWGSSSLYGAYTLCGSWGGRGTVWTGVNQTSWGTRFQEGSSRYNIGNDGGFTIGEWTSEEIDSKTMSSMKGTIYGAGYNYTVSEIGETNTITHIIDIDVKDLTVKVVNSRFTTN